MSWVPRDLAAPATISFDRWTLPAAETIYSFRSKRTVAKHKQYLPSIRGPHVLSLIYERFAALHIPVAIPLKRSKSVHSTWTTGDVSWRTDSRKFKKISAKINFLKTNHVFFIFRETLTTAAFSLARSKSLLSKVVSIKRYRSRYGPMSVFAVDGFFPLLKRFRIYWCALKRVDFGMDFYNNSDTDTITNRT